MKLNCLSHSHTGGNAVTGITLKYKDCDEVLDIKLQAIHSPEAERKRALVWLAVMQKVIIRKVKTNHMQFSVVCTFIYNR